MYREFHRHSTKRAILNAQQSDGEARPNCTVVNLGYRRRECLMREQDEQLKRRELTTARCRFEKVAEPNKIAPDLPE